MLLAARLFDAGGGHVAILEALEVRQAGRHAVVAHVLHYVPAHRILAALAAVGLACEALTMILKTLFNNTA